MFTPYSPAVLVLLLPGVLWADDLPQRIDALIAAQAGPLAAPADDAEFLSGRATVHQNRTLWLDLV
jgi:hypothetical protein